MKRASKEAKATTTPKALAPVPIIPTPQSDGFNAPDEAGGSGLIRGEKLKFSNHAEWLSGDSAIAADREFIVIKLLKATQKWLDGKPAETRILHENECFPDVEVLNAEAPREEWHEAFGQLRGPWQNTTFVYLLDPETMEALTWPTATVGGSIAIRELKDATLRARLLRGANLYPRVRLADKHMNTDYGDRRRPYFNICGFEAIGDTPPPAIAKPDPRPNSDMGGDAIPTF
jgi:hypothetical protein